MPRKRYKITKLAKSKRWRKKYLGQQYYFPMSDLPTEEDAWNAWLKKKADIDLEHQRTKPHKDEYEQAIQQRQELASWCREAGEHEQAKVFQQEADFLLNRFNRLSSPPPLTPDEADPISSIIKTQLADFQKQVDRDTLPPELRQAAQEGRLSMDMIPEIVAIREVWADRLQWLEKVEPERAISSHIDTYLSQKKARATGQQISLGYWAVLHAHMKRFQSWIGASFPVESISAKTLIDYHLHLLKLTQGGNISKKYAADNMASVRGFIRWAWELELCGLPRNINSKELRFNAGPSAITTC